LPGTGRFDFSTVSPDYRAMGVRQVAAVAVISAGVVIATDLLMHTWLLRAVRPRILSPADGEIVTGSVTVRWEGPEPMQATLSGNGQRVDLGLRENPFEIDASRFPKPGQYGIELRLPRLGSLVSADRRFLVRRIRDRPMPAEDGAADEPSTPPPTPARSDDPRAAQAEAERDQLRGELEQLQGLVEKLREDNADLGQALDELQADTDARLAAADQQRQELAREHLLALQENQFLRLRMENIPACTVWGYLAALRPQTNPSGRIVVVSDNMGSVFRTEADCARVRRGDPTGASPCVCVGAVLGGAP
jgi:hypothetical protein